MTITVPVMCSLNFCITVLNSLSVIYKKDTIYVLEISTMHLLQKKNKLNKQQIQIIKKNTEKKTQQTEFDIPFVFVGCIL